jgi:hypothetical protein
MVIDERTDRAYDHIFKVSNPFIPCFISLLNISLFIYCSLLLIGIFVFKTLTYINLKYYF